jgi:NADPH-dependent 7-cyano-7-deazaguanine reductase QueF-like protein
MIMKNKLSDLNQFGIDKKQLYEVWVQWNRLSLEVGKMNAISEMVISIESNNFVAFKYFILLGFESVNKEYFKEMENGTNI